MNNLEKYVGKKVIIVDIDNKEWNGIVDSYNPDDDFGDYEGESIDVGINDSVSDLVCFAKPQIKSIKLVK